MNANGDENNNGAGTLGGVGDLRRNAGMSELSGTLSEMPDDECVTVVLYPNIQIPAIVFDDAFVMNGAGTGNFNFSGIGSYQSHHYFRLIAVRDSSILMVQRKWGDIDLKAALSGTDCTGDPDDLATAIGLAPPTPGIG